MLGRDGKSGQMAIESAHVHRQLGRPLSSSNIFPYWLYRDP